MGTMTSRLDRRESSTSKTSRSMAPSRSLRASRRSRAWRIAQARLSFEPMRHTAADSGRVPSAKIARDRVVAPRSATEMNDGNGREGVPAMPRARASRIGSPAGNVSHRQFLSRRTAKRRAAACRSDKSRKAHARISSCIATGEIRPGRSDVILRQVGSSLARLGLPPNQRRVTISRVRAAPISIARS